MTNSKTAYLGRLRGLWPIGAFAAAYTLGALALGLARGNLEFLFYIAVMVVLAGAVLAVDWHVRLSSGALWCLAAWGFLHMAGGLVVVPEGWPVNADSRVLYSWWLVPERLKYDNVIHAYGFAVTTWVCWQGLRAAIARRGGEAAPTFGLMVLSVAAGLGFGAVNEVVEFAAVLLIPETNVGGYVNTGWDLVANTVGAVTAAAVIWGWGRRR